MQGLGSAGLDAPLQLLMGVKPDVVFCGCTSATLTHGSEFDKALAGWVKAESGTHTVTAAGALIAALGALRITRVGFVSPYVLAINHMAFRFWAQWELKPLPVQK